MIAHSGKKSQPAAKIAPLILTAILTGGWLPFGLPSRTVEQTRSQGTPFNPSRQPVISYSDGDFSIRVLPGAFLTLSISKRGGAPSYTRLPAEMAQANQVLRAQGSKVAIIGMLNGDAWVVAILDTTTDEIIDTIWCYAPSLSPNGRYLAFVKFFPTHLPIGPGQSGADDHYMVYDMEASPAQNRPLGARVSDQVDVGKMRVPSECRKCGG